MAGKKESTIFYQDQIDICKRHFNPEQFGRLMLALFEVEEGNDPEVDEDIAVAFEFMALQKKIDREKYEAICKRNRENGKKGGRPKKKTEDENPTKANGFFKNPNDNDNDKIMIRKDNDNVNEETHDTVLLGRFRNVDLTGQEYRSLKEEYESTTALIDKVSIWLRQTANSVPDHYALCLKFAANDDWPKRRRIEPAEEIVVTDPPTEEEREEMVREMRQKLGGVIGGKS